MIDYRKLLPTVLLFIFLASTTLVVHGEKFYALLAESFLKGTTYFQTLPQNKIDLSYFQGKYYWPIGPFPAILISPFVLLFSSRFEEGYIKLAVATLDFLLIFKLARSRINFDKSLSIATFFIFGSVFTPLAAIPYSSYFSQVIGISFLILSIYLFYSVKNFFLVGLALSFTIATRLELLGALAFFFILLIQRKSYLKNVITLLLPIIVTVSLLSLYNFARFGSIFETGHSHIINLKQTEILKKQGMFSKKHILPNLYYMFIKTPELNLKNGNLQFPYLKFNPFGMSIFILSPVLFLLFKAKINKLTLAGFFTALAIAIPAFAFYGIGFQQIGYRFAANFLPFLLLPLIEISKKVTARTLYVLTYIGVFITWFFIFEKIAYG